MRVRHLYLVLCVLGAVLLYSQLLPWLAAHGIDVSLFFRDLFTTASQAPSPSMRS